MKCPLLFTRAIPKFNTVLRIFEKEFSKFYGNSCRVDLIWVSGRVEDPSCDIKGISDDYDMFNVMVSNCLVYTTLNNKELSLGCGNIDSPV